jgi:protein SCO1/2
MASKPSKPNPKAPSNTAPYAIVGVVLAALLIGTGAFLWMTGANPAKSMIGGPFALVSGEGKAVTDKDFRGKYMLIYFGFTFCPDVCPTSLNTLSDALDRLGPLANRIQPLFITVDPKRDDQEAVARYAAAFGTRIIGLTGTQEQIDAAERLLDGPQLHSVSDGPGRQLHRPHPCRTAARGHRQHATEAGHVVATAAKARSRAAAGRSAASSPSRP